jgi:YbbR domain-containing protein
MPSRSSLGWSQLEAANHVAEGVKRSDGSGLFAPARPLGTAASTAGRQLTWLWSPESLLRLALSLVLATALWLYVTDKQNPTVVDLPQPVLVTAELRTGYTVLSTLPDVHIQYRIDNPNHYVAPTSFQASVNLLDKGVGTWPKVPVQVTSYDPAVHGLKASPAFVSVKIDSIIQDYSVPVVPRYIGDKPAPGYNAGTPNIQPNSITVKGAKSIVLQVARAEVNVPLTGAKSSILELAHLTLVDSRGQPLPGTDSLTLTPSQVQLSVPIKAVASFKSLPVLVALRGHPKAGYGVTRVDVQPPEITAKGLPSILSRLTSVTTAPVWVSNHGPGSITRRVSISLPRGVQSTARKVTVTVRLQTVEASTAIGVGVQPRNLTPGLSARILPRQVLVTIVGPSTSLRGAPREGLSATVDMGGYGAGTFQIKPRLTAPKGLAVEAVYPATVTVTLSAPSSLSP